MFELSKQFRFDVAHTLDLVIETESSRRVHGLNYRAEVFIRGQPDPTIGMVVDLGLLQRTMEDARDALDHRFLDDIVDLDPATMENLGRWIWSRLSPVIGNFHKVMV